MLIGNMIEHVCLPLDHGQACLIHIASINRVNGWSDTACVEVAT